MPRAGLSELVVIEEAEGLIDEVGLSRLTLAELAARLGVRQPSLYKHIQGTDGLVRSISVRAKNELAYVLARAAVGRERADALSSISDAYRAWALEHPGRYATVQSAPTPGDTEDEAASLSVLQVVTDILAGYKLADDDAIDAARALRSALHGFIALESSGGFGLPVDIDRSFQRMVNGLATAFSAWTEVPAVRARRK
ncbi:MAG TPA: WHG domain-containing protein [Solirubrobacteraceae bacterium]|nr:WHG domain-containing protein [Solirubrobacteraceae bacterium]